MKHLRYCATCREYYLATTGTPPHGALHKNGPDKTVIHLDPITREVLT